MIKPIAAAAVLVLAACSSAAGTPAPSVPPAETAVVPSADRAPAVITQTYVPPKTPTAAEVSARTCERVHSYLLARIVPTFDSWHITVDEFDQRVAGQLRSEATHLFSLERQSRGAVYLALEREALALTRLSIAIRLRDDSMVGSASNQGNAALASVRGVCNF